MNPMQGILVERKEAGQRFLTTLIISGYCFETQARRDTMMCIKLALAYLGSMCTVEQWKGGAKVLEFGMRCVDWMDWL